MKQLSPLILERTCWLVHLQPPESSCISFPPMTQLTNKTEPRECYCSSLFVFFEEMYFLVRWKKKRSPFRLFPAYVVFAFSWDFGVRLHGLVRGTAAVGFLQAFVITRLPERQGTIFVIIFLPYYSVKNY